METKTIEERAKSIYAFNCEEDDFGYCERQEAKQSGYIRGAKEQDCIARAEQREIDIQRAVEYYCKSCTGHCDKNCTFRNNLIKAIKGE